MRLCLKGKLTRTRIVAVESLAAASDEIALVKANGGGMGLGLATRTGATAVEAIANVKTTGSILPPSEDFTFAVNTKGCPFTKFLNFNSIAIGGATLDGVVVPTITTAPAELFN